MRVALILIALLLFLGPVTAQDKPKIRRTKSGLGYEVVDPGKGVRPKPGDEVSVHYVGRLKNGKAFEMTYGRKPLTFRLGTGFVIPGMDEGIALMPLGAKYRLHIPWKLAYGEVGSPPDIAPRTDLVFDVELLAVKEGIPLPTFRKGNPDRQIKTKSGLVYEVLVEGKGALPRKDQGVKIAYGLWNLNGDYIQSTAATESFIAGPIDSPRIGKLSMKFLPEAARMMREGTVLRLEVPANLCWGDRRMHPKLEPGAVSVWQLLLVKINDIPVFTELSPEKTQKTEDGLQYEILNAGEGKRPDLKAGVEVRFTSWLANGKRFDSSHARGDTTTFPLSSANPPGMKKAILLMKEGAIYRVKIPKSLGYGKKPPQGSGVPEDAELVFLVELVRVIR